MNCEGGRAMIDYKQKSVSGQFIFSVVTPPSSQSLCQCSVSPVSDEAMSGLRPLPNAQCCQLRPISGEWSLSQTQSTNHAWRDEGFSRHPAVRYTPHFSWTMRVVADTPHVSLSLDLLLFSSLPKWKLMLTIKHQTLTRTEHGTKGTMQSLCRHTRPSWTIDESVKCNFYHSFLMSATIKKIILW